MSELHPLVFLCKLWGMLGKPCGKHFQCPPSMPVDKQRALVPKGCPLALRPFHQPHDLLKEKQKWKINARTFREGLQPQGRRFILFIYFCPRIYFMLCLCSCQMRQGDLNIHNIVQTQNERNSCVGKDELSAANQLSRVKVIQAVLTSGNAIQWVLVLVVFTES